MALTHLTSETFDQAVNAGDDLVVVDKLTWEPTDDTGKPKDVPYWMRMRSMASVLSLHHIWGV